MTTPTPSTAMATAQGRHAIDADRLAAYLHGLVPEMEVPLQVLQFRSGQSNPTFLITSGNHSLVLRKKPPGELLPGAHQIEREFAFMSALAGSGVPVPRMIHLCQDHDVIGTPFYIMSYVAGRIEALPHLPSIPKADRRSAYFAMASTLARLHEVDWRRVGLAEFGRPHSFILRQTNTWYQQFHASKTFEIPAMDRLYDWLTTNAPAQEETCIVHGDFRPGNIILESEAPRIGAVLDWELAAIGHPIADLAYLLTPWYLPSGIVGVRGLLGIDLKQIGLPAAEEIAAAYADARGLERIDELGFFVIFSMFRLAAILQGVYARAMKGNSSNADAAMVGGNAKRLADQAWSRARES